jgi:hypothetical protein
MCNKLVVSVRGELGVAIKSAAHVFVVIVQKNRRRRRVQEEDEAKPAEGEVNMDGERSETIKP